MRLFFLALLFLSTFSISQAEAIIKVKAPDYVVMEDSVTIELIKSEAEIGKSQGVNIKDNKGNQYSFSLDYKETLIKIPIQSSSTFEISSTGFQQTIHINKVPGWFSIIPPLVAIALALIFKEVILSLFAGIFIGAIGVYGFSLSGILKGFFAIIDKYFFVALGDSGNLSVIIFSVGIGGMVSVISKNGGMHGIVEKLSRFARSARSAQLVTWAMGIAIFFDDYANTLIVGNTMRPVTDRFKVSREKLSYIVDSTAAPIAALAFITTWIGAELGYISKASESLGIDEGPYSMFLNSLQYAYYPLLTLIFMFIILWQQKDYGPMYQAEKDARESKTEYDKDETNDNNDEEHFKPVDKSKARWYNGFIPVMMVIAVTIFGLMYTGLDIIRSSMLELELITKSDGFIKVWNSISFNNNTDLSTFRKLGIVIGEADAYISLLWATFSGIATAVALSVSQKIMSITETMSSLIEGFKTMVPPMLILILAWSLTEVTHELQTAEFITSVFKGNINPIFMPAITFLLAAFIAFSTGSSWGTMAILYPLALPASWVLCQETGMGMEESMSIFYHVIAVVLAGSVLGDHCSPISDTTILSSLASQCYHLDHVRTQMPYALTVGFISFLISFLAHIIPIHWSVLYILGIALIYLAVRIFGKKVEIA
ncbi:Na+/H+ antiporter NhaC family protein [Hyphobacterium sp. CCMP332]|nr:Na+/H+ antiporter NhaC family protein [Hyphobacterium sp. CCMP332]